MKKLLILVLALALLAAAFFTRPSHDSFNSYYSAQQSAAASGGLSLKGVFQNLKSGSYLNAVVFHDRLLWTTITEGDQTRYVGAFGHWFKQS